ncbi:hypothetical protein MJT46_018785 [Ovis ammon polii x Ovis aries]|nr:hypothetical protein MJT46_018785 [Ovis ammon polii x Ovis aries]
MQERYSCTRSRERQAMPTLNFIFMGMEGQNVRGSICDMSLRSFLCGLAYELLFCIRDILAMIFYDESLKEQDSTCVQDGECEAEFSPDGFEEKPEKEKKQTSFTLCTVCNIQLNSTAQAQIHYNGKSHQKRVKQLSSGTVRNDSGEAPPSRPARWLEDFQEVSGSRVNDRKLSKEMAVAQSHPCLPLTKEIPMALPKIRLAVKCQVKYLCGSGTIMQFLIGIAVMPEHPCFSGERYPTATWSIIPKAWKQST